HLRMASLIHRIDDGVYAFLHLDFRDYFAAEYLRQYLQLTEIKEIIKSEAFRQINRLFLTRENKRILQLLAELISNN
ncbi:hypothetical protein OFO99_40995, partial [Escherichia coli]|nr:hypothetical protein [Escherichia coli]